MAFEYTENQKKAISHQAGNLLILACAGSGKTEVLACRIANLVKAGNDKSSIIAFTFTERAAGELKSRIRLKLEESCPDDPSLGDMYVGTIHSFCLQLLKEIDASYRKYEVMDEARQVALVMTRFRRGIGLERLRSRTRTKGYWDTVRTFLTTLNVLHQKGINLGEIDDPGLVDCVERYRSVAYDTPNFFFDFDEIIHRLLARLKSDDEALTWARKKFRHLIVDEYQDVDDRQEELIALLSNCGKDMSITAVGDDDQAIYGWRGAKIQNILNFAKKYPDVLTVTLAHNFRSSHAIVELANVAIREIPPDRRSGKNMEALWWNSAKKKFEELMSERGDIQAWVLPSEQAEAEWVAERIFQLRGTVVTEKDGSSRAIDWADMAILLRSVRTTGRTFSAELTARGIPCIVKGTGGLFDHREVLIVYAAFCLLARWKFMYDEGNGPQTRDEVYTREFIRDRVRGLREERLMPYADPYEFLEWIAEKREELDKRNLEKSERKGLARRIYPQDIFQEMLNQLGTAKDSEPWPPSVLYNLGRLSALITQFEAVHQWVTPGDLGSLCLFLGGWAAEKVDEGGVDEMVAPNAVQIMTVHAAKGLEWPVVFLPRVCSSNFPSRFRNQGPETFLPECVFDTSEYASGDDGERRLWYVALTRCRKFLNITSPERKGKKPSVYFKEIKHDYVQRQGEIGDRLKGVPSPPANAELLPTTYSDLNYYWRCPFEYQLRALMGFGPGVKESYGYGQQIHNVLAEVHKQASAGHPLSIDEVMALVEKRFHLRYTRDGVAFKPLTQLRKAAQASLRRYLENYPDSTSFVLASEKPFEFVDHESGALISGTIDLLEKIEPANGERIPVAIVDFKTHAWRDTATYLRARSEAEKQLLLYAVAAHRALNFEAQEARAHFLTPKALEESQQESFAVDIGATRLEQMREDVRDAVRGIRKSVASSSFALRGCEGGHCPHCDYRTFCPGFNEWKKRERILPRPLSPADERLAEILRTTEDTDARNESK